jgi:hypothetical protein
MDIHPFFKGVYYSIRYIADEFDNAFSMSFSPCYTEEYQKLCYDTAMSYKIKAKENFRLTLERYIKEG